MSHSFSPETLADAGMRYVRHMELDDLAAMKICLLSTGALLGLSCKGKLARRLTGLTCSFLAAGLAIPLTSRFLDELKPGDPVLTPSPSREEAPVQTAPPPPAADPRETL